MDKLEQLEKKINQLYPQNIFSKEIDYNNRQFERSKQEETHIRRLSNEELNVLENIDRFINELK